MVTYSTNWMGPISLDWYIERGLTRKVWKTARVEKVAQRQGVKVGEQYEAEEVTTEYACGRIDIRDDSKPGYDGWHEYGLPPMHVEDWAKLSDWLEMHEDEERLSYPDLIFLFEHWMNRPIRWADC